MEKEITELMAAEFSYEPPKLMEFDYNAIALVHGTSGGNLEGEEEYE